jgi:hypothetical protein
MKAIVWLLFVAFVVWSIACCLVSYAILSPLTERHGYTLVLPGATKLLVHHYASIPLFSVPWLIYAILLSVRREPSLDKACFFGGTVVLGMSVLTCIVVLACVLPYITLNVQFQP